MAIRLREHFFLPHIIVLLALAVVFGWIMHVRTSSDLKELDALGPPPMLLGLTQVGAFAFAAYATWKRRAADA